MSVHAQLDFTRGTNIAKVHSGWGVPRMVLAALRGVAGTGKKTPQAIAKEFIRQYERRQLRVEHHRERFPAGCA